MMWRYFGNDEIHDNNLEVMKHIRGQALSITMINVFSRLNTVVPG